MNKYVVSYLNFFDNLLESKVVEVEGDWYAALMSAYPDYAEYLPSDNIEDAHNTAFDQDWVFNVLQIN